MIRRIIIPLLVLASVAGAPVLRAQAPPTKPQGVIIQRILVKVNGDILTQKELEQRQVLALRDQGKGDLTGDALYKALEDITPEILVSSIDELLIVQRGRELGYH